MLHSPRLLTAFVLSVSLTVTAVPASIAATQHSHRVHKNGGWAYRHRAIISLVTASNAPVRAGVAAHRTLWHVAWCRPNRGVMIGTQTSDPQARKPHFAPHWVYDTVRRGEIRVAVNGAVFNESIAPSLPIGGVGNGESGWKSGSDATAKKFCLGLSGTTQPTREGYPPFRIDPMHYVYSRAGTGANEGKMIPFYSVSPFIRIHYPYGFGCVGALVRDGRFIENSVDGGWQDGQSLRPNMPLTRTLVAWTREGEFFIIVAAGGMNTQGPGTLEVGDGATWADAIDFLRRGLPGLIAESYPACWRSASPPRIWGAAMFDGGPSAQIGYKRVDRRGWINLDRSAPHGDETAPNFQIPSFLYAIAPASDRLPRKRHHRRRLPSPPPPRRRGARGPTPTLPKGGRRDGRGVCFFS